MSDEEPEMNPSRLKLIHLWQSVQRIITDSATDESRCTEEHEKRIRVQYNQLLSSLTCVPEIASKMFQEGKLTDKEYEAIRRCQSTPIRACEELLAVIIRSGRDIYESFLSSLKKTKQPHVHQLLTSDQQNSSCSGDQHDIVLEHSRLIRQNYDWLTEALDPDSGLLPILFQRHVLSSREYEHIRSSIDQFTRNESLLFIISRKSVDDFHHFLAALNETNQRTIARKLTTKQPSTASVEAVTSVTKTTSGLPGSPRKTTPAKCSLDPLKQQQSPSSSSDRSIPARSTTSLKAKAPPKLNHTKAVITERRKKPTRQETMKKRFVSDLESKFIELQDELQTDISTKVALIKQKTTTDNLLTIYVQKILQESQKVKRVKIVQDKTSDEKYNKLMQEILKEKAKCKRLKDEIQQEKSRTEKRLQELQDSRAKLLDLEDRHDKERKSWTTKEEQLMKLTQELRESLVNRKDLSDLEQKLEEERDVWTTEREELIKQTQEQRKLIEKLRNRYESEPVLVRKIRTKAAKDEKKEISGLTILDRKLFVVNGGSSEVEVYDSVDFDFIRKWTLEELVVPVDIASCSGNQCLYIMDWKDSGHLSKVLRVDPHGMLILKWPTVGGQGRLSVTSESNVILTIYEENKLNEYSSDGQLLREIRLSSDAGIVHTLHSIKLSSGHFVVSHGDDVCDLHRVCIVDEGGHVMRSFGGKKGSTIGQMNPPIYLAVDRRSGFVLVADLWNHRVLLLDSNLEFKREILTKQKHGLRLPFRILLDDSNGRLFVADNEWESEIDGRILIFDFNGYL